MIRTLYLHIGTHRTATTSIQAFLHANSDALLRRGYFYPYGVRRHLELVNQIFSGEQAVSDVCDTIQGRADSRRSEIHSVILSDEDICMRRDLSVLAQFRERFDVKVIFALRRQDIWLESWYFQNIKWQWQPALAHCTFDEFMEMRERFHWIDYDRYLRHLEGLFGRENVLPIVFEKESMPKGPIAKFCRTAGIEDLEGFGKVPHNNSSRSPEMAEFMRHLPLDQASVPVRNALVSACERVDRTVLGSNGRRSKQLLDFDRRAMVLKHFAAGNHAVAQRYFDRDALFQAPLPTRDDPLAEMKLPETPEKLMERLVNPLLLELMAKGYLVSAKDAAKLKQ
jgi:hypothetical protein